MAVGRLECGVAGRGSCCRVLEAWCGRWGVVAAKSVEHAGSEWCGVGLVVKLGVGGGRVPVQFVFGIAGLLVCVPRGRMVSGMPHGLVAQ